MIRVEAAHQVTSIVQVLKHIQARPSAFIGSLDNTDALVTLLEGFLLACHVLGYSYGPDIERQVFKANGWERRADGVWLQMREKGLSEEVIVQNLIKLEIEKWQQFEVKLL